MSDLRGAAAKLRFSAGLIVKVYPLGESQVAVDVENLGPEPLSRQEARWVLRQALDALYAELGVLP
jgi:hypothetical protein